MDGWTNKHDLYNYEISFVVHFKKTNILNLKQCLRAQEFRVVFYKKNIIDIKLYINEI